MNILKQVVSAQHQGKPIGVYSICSANRYVLKSALLQAKRDQSGVLIEPTVNQVNQFGGYTGRNPAQFVEYIHQLAESVEFDPDRIILGGDHLGPNPWRKGSAKQAMENSRTLVRDYVLAGYTKIHIDTSIRCADDDGDAHQPLDDTIVATRAAELCQVAEEAIRQAGSNIDDIVYVIGTEVPIPGGAEGALHDLQVTSVKAAKRTLEVTKEIFSERGLHAAWSRVIAQVVQPGVEFGNEEVVEYDPEIAQELSQFIEKYDDKVFEAHSTDYQTQNGLKNLVRDHFAILKVGPGLTYAFREAVFALSIIEEELALLRKGMDVSNFRDTLEKIMLDQPGSWEDHYSGTDPQLAFLRKYSYSDRSRYYWQQTDVKESLRHLFNNLSKEPIPLTLLSQYLPKQYHAIRAGDLTNDPEQIALHKIQEITELYSNATQFKTLF